MKIFKKIMDLIVLCVVIGGLAAICYPSFSTYINQRFATPLIEEYKEEMATASEAELEETKRLADAYNALLPISFPADPFTGTNIQNFEGTEFEDFYMLQEGSMIGYIEIPSIDVYLPIYYGTTDEVLNEGLGLLENTSLPVGGENTHAVISGHSGLASKRLFTDLNLMQEDDVFFVHVLNQDFAYQVYQIKVVLPTETDDLYIEEGKEIVTLVTCTPFGVNDHRLLVTGERIDYDFSTEEKQTVNAQVMRDKYLWVYVMTAVIIVIVLYAVTHRRKRK